MDGQTLEDALYDAAHKWAAARGLKADIFSLDYARDRSTSFRWKVIDKRLLLEFLRHG